MKNLTCLPWQWWIEVWNVDSVKDNKIQSLLPMTLKSCRASPSKIIYIDLNA